MDIGSHKKNSFLRSISSVAIAIHICFLEDLYDISTSVAIPAAIITPIQKLFLVSF
jgi:hypothetical protein